MCVYWNVGSSEFIMNVFVPSLKLIYIERERMAVRNMKYALPYMKF